jgi:hypothetical protein|nr:MAG TPA: hypothetical protein [Caudoviricetes sp.]
MERLTKISEIGNAYYPKCFEEPCCGMGECLDDKCSLMLDACKKLAEYEQLEEQGLLVRLPCKVGDMLWYNILGYTESYEIKAFSYGYCDGYIEAGEEIGDEIIFYCENHTGSIIGSFPMSGIGKIVFLTREEAVNKLEEMKNG